MRPRRVVMALALALATASASAQVVSVGEAVEAEHRRGMALFREHRDAEAREVFRALAESTREPRALARLAATEASLGEWVQAEEHLRAALELRTDPWVIANRASADGGLEGDLRRYSARVGRIDVRCETPSAELWLGGRRAATLPLREPLRVAAGVLTFEVRAPGHVTEVRQETVPGGPDGLVRVLVALSPAPAAPPLAVVTARPAIGPLAGLAPPRQPLRQPEPSRPPWLALGLAGTGLGLVGIVVGAAGLVLRNGHATAFNDIRRCGVTNDVVLGGVECQREYDQREPLETLATAGFVAGGALLATGVTALVLHASSLRPRAQRVSLTGAPGDLGLGLRLSF